MSQHTDVGAYSMGLLEPADRQAFEEHLAGCAACAAEVAELSSLAGLLRDIDPADVTGESAKAGESARSAGEPVPSAEAAEPPPAAVTDLLRKRAARQQQRNRWQLSLAAAAAVVLIGGGVGIGLATAPSHGSPAPAAVSVVGQLHSAVNVTTGVAGTVGLVSKPWGTQVTMDLSNVSGPLECQLIAVSKSGEQRVVAGWTVPAAGYGMPSHPAHLVLEGGTSIQSSNLARLVVDVVKGGTLLSIPVQSASG
ncbi:MAG: zf-HC2 domain-containing protein [Streptosporangiaceae bacterium]